MVASGTSPAVTVSQSVGDFSELARWDDVTGVRDPSVLY